MGLGSHTAALAESRRLLGDDVAEGLVDSDSDSDDSDDDEDDEDDEEETVVEAGLDDDSDDDDSDSDDSDDEEDGVEPSEADDSDDDDEEEGDDSDVDKDDEVEGDEDEEDDDDVLTRMELARRTQKREHVEEERAAAPATASTRKAGRSKRTRKAGKRNRVRGRASRAGAKTAGAGASDDDDGDDDDSTMATRRSLINSAIRNPVERRFPYSLCERKVEQRKYDLTLTSLIPITSAVNRACFAVAVNPACQPSPDRLGRDCCAHLASSFAAVQMRVRKDCAPSLLAATLGGDGASLDLELDRSAADGVLTVSGLGLAATNASSATICLDLAAPCADVSQLCSPKVRCRWPQLAATTACAPPEGRLSACAKNPLSDCVASPLLLLQGHDRLCTLTTCVGTGLKAPDAFFLRRSNHLSDLRPLSPP